MPEPYLKNNARVLVEGGDDFSGAHLMASDIDKGFSLLEVLVVAVIIFVLAALAVPTIITQVYAIRIRHSATTLSQQLQRARMEAVRKNSFYSLQYASGSPATVTIVDKGGALVTSIPAAVLGANVNGYYGTGSGAPGESAFVASLGFVPASSLGSPSFNARGLPCVPVAATTCPMLAGQGFVFFLSGPASVTGALGWSAVAVTPSGRSQVWAYDGANWMQL